MEYVIYKKHVDYPHQFALFRETDDQPLALTTTIEAARNALPLNCSFTRDTEKYEVWEKNSTL